jgi:methionyl aminopeptidase
MAIITNSDELSTLRTGGKRLARILQLLAADVRPGARTDELDTRAEQLIRDGGDVPAFLNYQPEGASRPYPATLCLSINDEIVHGIPTEHPRTIRDGDIVSLDLGLIHDGLVVDAALTVGAGKLDEGGARLLQATEEALAAGISAARPGNTIGDIGASVEAIAEKWGYRTPYELGGHGVGRSVHEDPHIPNFGDPGTGERIVEGMVLALEPMLTEGSDEIVLGDDGYTFKTADGSRAAHFEHTVFVTKNGAEVITRE